MLIIMSVINGHYLASVHLSTDDTQRLIMLFLRFLSRLSKKKLCLNKKYITDQPLMLFYHCMEVRDKEYCFCRQGTRFDSFGEYFLNCNLT